MDGLKKFSKKWKFYQINSRLIGVGALSLSLWSQSLILSLGFNLSVI